MIELQKTHCELNIMQDHSSSPPFDALIVIIASHGCQPSKSGMPQIIASDGKPIAISEMKDMFNRAAMRQHIKTAPVIFIIDACRNDPSDNQKYVDDEQKSAAGPDRGQHKKLVNPDSEFITIYASTAGYSVLLAPSKKWTLHMATCVRSIPQPQDK